MTDCVLIGGDSGGPLFDTKGRVIGIHSSIGASVAENRHVSIATFDKHWDRLIRGEKWGILPELAHKQNPQDPHSGQPERPNTSLGIRVDRAATDARILIVHPGGAAEAAGILAGDVVIQFDGFEVTNSNILIDLIQQRRPGDSVKLKIRRGSDEITVTVFLGEKAALPPTIGSQGVPNGTPMDGIILPGHPPSQYSLPIPLEGQTFPIQEEFIIPGTPGGN